MDTEAQALKRGEVEGRWRGGVGEVEGRCLGGGGEVSGP